MTTSNYMPDVKVEVAFNAGFTTPAGSRTWTDISTYVELQDEISIKFGRRDEFSVADPNELTLTLDNRDGRFTANRSASPYYPNVKLFRPIRVTATPVGGSASVRFLGYVQEWPVLWSEGTSEQAYVTITAVSRLSLLAQQKALRSMVEQEILLDAPMAYYTLGDPAGSAGAADSSGFGGEPLIQASTDPAAPSVSFGSGMYTPAEAGVPHMPAAIFTDGGKILRIQVPDISVPKAFEMFISIPPNTLAHPGSYMIGGITNPTTPELVLGWRTINTDDWVGIAGGAGATIFGNVLEDGQPHHLFVQQVGATGTEAYIDGVLVTSGSSALTPTSRPGWLEVDGSLVNSSPLPTPAFNSTIANVAIYDHSLSSTRIAAHAKAGGVGSFGDTTAARLTRIAAYGGVPAAEVSSSGAVLVSDSAGSFDSATDLITGQSPLEAMRDVESTEVGVLYDERDGTLTLTSRAARYSATVALTIDMALQRVGSDFSLTFDSAFLLNNATVTGPGSSATYTDDASVSDYGIFDASLNTFAADDNEPIAIASWQVNANSQPKARVPALTIDVIGSGLTQNTVAGLTIDSLVSVTNQPGQAAASSGSYFVEGYTETFGPESWVIGFYVSDATTYLSTWQLDSGTRSQLGSTTITAL